MSKKKAIQCYLLIGSCGPAFLAPYRASPGTTISSCGLQNTYTWLPVVLVQLGAENQVNFQRNFKISISILKSIKILNVWWLQNSENTHLHVFTSFAVLRSKKCLFLVPAGFLKLRNNHIKVEKYIHKHNDMEAFCRSLLSCYIIQLVGLVKVATPSNFTKTHVW